MARGVFFGIYSILMQHIYIHRIFWGVHDVHVSAVILYSIRILRAHDHVKCKNYGDRVTSDSVNTTPLNNRPRLDSLLYSYN
jgi:hypothetical protein